MNKKTKIILTSVAATSVASGLLAGLYAAYRIAFHSPKGNQNDDFEYRFTEQTRPRSYKIFRMIGDMHAKEYEKVSITSFDGLKLAGRYYEAAKGAPLCSPHRLRGPQARDGLPLGPQGGRRRRDVPVPPGDARLQRRPVHALQAGLVP